MGAKAARIQSMFTFREGNVTEKGILQFTFRKCNVYKPLAGKTVCLKRSDMLQHIF
jgi:transcriptional/translational regulatory protein YebC/TACO1